MTLLSGISLSLKILKPVVTQLCHDLNAVTKELRVEALEGLFRLAVLDDLEAKEAMRTIVRQYKQFDTELYGRAISRLFCFADESLREPLLECLKDDSYGCKESAASGCGFLRIREALPAILPLLENPNHMTRIFAAESLGDLGDASAVPDLVKRLYDESDYVRESAAEALGKIQGIEAMEGLWRALITLCNTTRPHYTAHAMSKFGEPVKERLLEALRSENPNLRYYAARTLGSMTDREITVELQKIAVNDNALTHFGGRVGTAAKKALKTADRIKKNLLPS